MLNTNYLDLWEKAQVNKIVSPYVLDGRQNQNTKAGKRGILQFLYP